MIRTLWFFVKLAALLAVLIWIMQEPGTVDINWLGYEIETSVGVAVAAVIILFFIWTQFYRLYRAVVAVPDIYRRHKKSKDRETGYRRITQGLVAIAAGDGDTADRMAAAAAEKLGDAPLLKLLQAQAGLMNGRAPQARRLFTELMDDRDTAFFGLRGLLAEHLRERNHAEAVLLMRQAAVLQPDRIWVLRTLFDLETRNRHWKNARQVLKRGEKRGAFDARTVARHLQALYLAEAEEADAANELKRAVKLAGKAFALDAGFTPAGLRLAQYHERRGNRRAVVKVLQKTWHATPHPDIADMWLRYAPPVKTGASIYDAGRESYKWTQKLADLRPQHRYSHLALGRAALALRLWVEARTHLTEAQDYRSLAALERAENNNETRARAWLDRADEAPPPAQWVCQDCGHAARTWQLFCPSCQVFDQLEWMVPDSTMTPVILQTHRNVVDLLAPPAA